MNITFEMELKAVNFGYCELCRHKEAKGCGNPCNICRSIFGRDSSHKPQYFEEDKNVTAK